MFTSKPVFLHIGLPKTGTTTLQQGFFRRCPSTRYAGKPGIDPLISAITEPDDRGWAADLDPTFRRAARLFGGPEERVLISEEELSVGSLNGLAEPEAIGQRLHLLFPRATVLIVLRNQLTLLCSLYAYAMALPGADYAPFNAWLDDLRSAPATGRGLHLFDYAQLVGLYAGLFGRDNVHVLLYDQFVGDRETFMGALAGILGVGGPTAAWSPDLRLNARPSLRTVRAQRIAERHPWTKRAVGALPRAARTWLADAIRRGPPLDTRFSAENEAFVREYFGPGNRRLVEEHGVPIAALGYPV